MRFVLQGAACGTEPHHRGEGVGLVDGVGDVPVPLPWRLGVYVLGVYEPVAVPAKAAGARLLAVAITTPINQSMP